MKKIKTKFLFFFFFSLHIGSTGYDEDIAPQLAMYIEASRKRGFKDRRVSSALFVLCIHVHIYLICVYIIILLINLPEVVSTKIFALMSTNDT